MKTTFLVAAAALAAGVSARQNHRRHNHESLHSTGQHSASAHGTGHSHPSGIHPSGHVKPSGHIKPSGHVKPSGHLGGAPGETCAGVTTIYTTITGEGSLYFPPPPATSSPSSSPVAPTPTSTVQVVTVPVVPTPLSTTCPTPGVYTIPATTIVLTETKTVPCESTTSTYPPGTYTQPEVVTTVTKTNYVVVCPYTSSAAPTKSAAPAPVSAAPTKAAPTSAAAPSKPASSSSPSTGGLGNSGNQWAMTYSPYTNTGACKEAGDVTTDVAKIAKAGFKTVRVYSTDCYGLKNIGDAAEANGLKMIIGVFINASGISGAQQQVTDIISWGKFYLVELIVVGNEAVFGGFCSASDLATFITSSKSKFEGAGYSGPCTTTEPLETWQANKGALCGAVDVVGANIHAFFNPNTPAEKAGDFVKSQLDIVDGLCPGKSGVNLETGWPSSGSCNGQACPGQAAQATAIKGITESCGGKSVVFSFTDDSWKAPGQYGIEQFWGSIQLFN